jgi:hypothetical protein
MTATARKLQDSVEYYRKQASFSEELTYIETVSDSTISFDKDSSKQPVSCKGTKNLSRYKSIVPNVDLLNRQGIPSTKKTRSFPPVHHSINFFRKRSKSLHQSPAEPIRYLDRIENDEIRENINESQDNDKMSDSTCENRDTDFVGLPSNVLIQPDLTSPSSFESILLQARYLTITDSELCSTIVQDHEKLEVVACLNHSMKLRSWSAVHPLEEKPIDSTFKVSSSHYMESQLCRGIRSTVEAAHLFACLYGCCYGDPIDISPKPSTADVIEISTGFNISCTSASGRYENMDPHSLGVFGSVAVFEQGDISAMDLASEIMAALLRRDLKDAEFWCYQVPLVSHIDVNSDVVDSCFLILQAVKNNITGVKATALGYVLFMMKCKEIRVGKYCLTFH